MNDTNSRLALTAAVLLLTAQMTRIFLVFTDVFNQFCIGKQVVRHGYGPGFYIGLRIIDIELNFHVSEVASDVAFDDAQGVGRRVSPKIKPRVIDESLRIDNESVPFPAAKGITKIRRCTILGSLMTVGKN